MTGKFHHFVAQLPSEGRVISYLMDITSGTIDSREFKQVLNELASRDKLESNQGNIFMHSFRKTLLGKLSQSNVKRKLDVAFPLTDIDRVESLNICFSSKTQTFARSSWANVSFAVFLRSLKDPLILVCSKPEQREAWLDAFRMSLVNYKSLGGDMFQRECDDKPGWQHKLVRESLFSLIVCDDHSGLSRYLEDPSPDATINDHDEYYGFTALHYAVIWNRLECAALLLANGAEVNSKDNDKKTPIDHGELLLCHYLCPLAPSPSVMGFFVFFSHLTAVDEDVIRLLQSYGGQGNPKLKNTLYDQAHEKQRLIASNKTQTAMHPTISQANNTIGIISDTIPAMRERGEKLEKIEKATSSLERDAANYADMAKLLKGKSKKGFMFRI